MTRNLTIYDRLHGIDPPRVGHRFHREDDNSYEGQPAARDAFHGVGSHGAASQLVGKGDLAASEIAHDRDRDGGHHEARKRKALAMMRRQAPPGRGDDVGRQREQQTAANSARQPLGILRERLRPEGDFASESYGLSRLVDRSNSEIDSPGGP